MSGDIVSPGYAPMLGNVWIGETRYGPNVGVDWTGATLNNWCSLHGHYAFGACPGCAAAPNVWIVPQTFPPGAHCETHKKWHVGGCPDCWAEAFSKLAASPVAKPGPLTEIVARAKARMTEIDTKIAEADKLRAERDALARMVAAAETK